MEKPYLLEKKEFFCPGDDVNRPGRGWLFPFPITSACAERACTSNTVLVSHPLSSYTLLCKRFARVCPVVEAYSEATLEYDGSWEKPQPGIKQAIAKKSNPRNRKRVHG
jgi:hypothetical protein